MKRISDPDNAQAKLTDALVHIHDILQELIAADKEIMERNRAEEMIRLQRYPAISLNSAKNLKDALELLLRATSYKSQYPMRSGYSWTCKISSF